VFSQHSGPRFLTQTTIGQAGNFSLIVNGSKEPVLVREIKGSPTDTNWFAATQKARLVQVITPRDSGLRIFPLEVEAQDVVCPAPTPRRRLGRT